MLRYPIGSNVFHPIAVTVDGEVHATGVSFAVMPDDTRPTAGDYTDTATLGGKTGVFTNPAGTRTAGVYRVWAKVSDVSPESPEIDCGPQFRLW